MTRTGQPFEGIRVIEVGQYIAAPYCGQLLAEGGAHVIKVEAVSGEPTRQTDPVVPNESFTFISPNRGKHSLPLKLGSPSAKAVMDSLLKSADVLLMNLRPGLAAGVDLDVNQLVTKFPRLIIGEVTPFGKHGPDSQLAGMDVVVQARCGLMAAIGRIDDERPAPGNAIVSDYMAAMTLSFGISSALFRRERTGIGGVVDVSLMQSGMALAANHFIRNEDTDGIRHRELIRRVEAEREAGASIREQLEISGLSSRTRIRGLYFRTYNTASAPIAISCIPKTLQLRFMELLGLTDRGLQKPQPSLPTNYYTNLKIQAENAISTQSAEMWIKKMVEVGIPVSPVKLPIEIFDDPQAEANSLFYTMDHPLAGRLKVMAPPLKLSEDGFQPVDATAPLGSETREILREAGWKDDQITELVRNGIIAT